MDKGHDLHVTEPLAYFIYFIFTAYLFSLRSMSIPSLAWSNTLREKLGKLILNASLLEKNWFLG